MLDGVLVIATDLDGTLLRSDGTVGPRVRTALAAADGAGVTVVAVTARPLRFVRPALAGLSGLHGTVVCANGALVADLATLTPRWSRELDAPSAGDVVAALRAAVPGVAFAVETLDGFGHEPHYVCEWPVPDGTPVAPVEDLLHRPLLKLLGRHPSIHVRDLDALVAHVGHRATVTCSATTGLIEVGPPGVDKATGLRDVVAAMGMHPRQVVAVGDMPNDLPMLRWAGTSAAVGNAHGDVLAAVDLVLPSNDDEGVAELVDRVLAARAGSRN